MINNETISDIIRRVLYSFFLIFFLLQQQYMINHPTFRMINVTGGTKNAIAAFRKRIEGKNERAPLLIVSLKKQSIDRKVSVESPICLIGNIESR